MRLWWLAFATLHGLLNFEFCLFGEPEGPRRISFCRQRVPALSRHTQ